MAVVLLHHAGIRMALNGDSKDFGARSRLCRYCISILLVVNSRAQQGCDEASARSSCDPCRCVNRMQPAACCKAVWTQAVEGGASSYMSQILQGVDYSAA